MTPILHLESVTQRLGGRDVLRDISFSVNAGESIALLGPSGCGKSTLLRILSGLDAPAAGRVFLDKQPASETDRILIPPHRRGIGMVFQDLALWPGLTVLENVAAGLGASAGNRAARRDAARSMLKRCGLAGFDARRPDELSAGQQQRVALARACVARPRLLLLDEPFTGLDLTVKESILGEIATLARDADLTLILVTHDPWEVSTLCRRAVVIEDGALAEDVDLTNPLAEPASPTLCAMRRAGEDKKRFRSVCLDRKPSLSALPCSEKNSEKPSNE